MNTGSASFPRYSTSFVGREREATELVNQVANNRFVGLIGPGGVGKTRLAAHAAPGLRQLFDEGLTTVDVVGTVTPAEFRARVADAIGLRDADVASLEALTDALRGRRALLVLDGCELFDSESRMTVQQLLDSSDTLSILATSRRALYVDGGVVLALAPLSVPPAEFELPETGMSPDEVGRYEAVRLFVERARLVRSHFDVTPANAASVARLCRRLDGLPLAVELAASWVRALSVDQIIDRMERSADFPRAGTTNIAPRHRTLGSLVAGTFDLCTPEEQTLWARMTVFRESFDLPAVEAVCGGPPLDGTDLLDTIASLVDQSVVVVDDTSGDSRYRLLRLTREYGATRLGNPDDVRARHREHFDELMSEYVQRWPGPGQIRLLSQVRLDYANIMAAIDWGLHEPETVRASVRMAADLWCFWFAIGRLTEGRSVLGRVAAAPLLDATAVERVRALYFHSYLSVLQGDARSARKLHDTASASQPDVPSDALCRGLDLQLDAMIGMADGDGGNPSASLDQAIATFAQGEDPRTAVMFMDAIGVSVLLAALRGQSDYANELGIRGLAASDENSDVIMARVHPVRPRGRRLAPTFVHEGADGGTRSAPGVSRRAPGHPLHRAARMVRDEPGGLHRGRSALWCCRPTLASDRWPLLGLQRDLRASRPVPGRRPSGPDPGSLRRCVRIRPPTDRRRHRRADRPGGLPRRNGGPTPTGCVAADPPRARGSRPRG